MADESQQPLLPVAAAPAAGVPVRGSRAERFVSWFRRLSRQKRAPPSRAATTPAPPSSAASLAAAAADFAEAAARGSAFGDEAKRFADAARAFADGEEEEPRVRPFAPNAWALDVAEDDEEEHGGPQLAQDFMGRASALAVAADLLLQQEGLSMPSTTTGLALRAFSLSVDSQALLPPFELLPPSSAHEFETELMSLIRRAKQFSTEASGTTLEESAKAFHKAAEEFISGDRNYKKVADIPLSKAAMNLSTIASMAPPEEKKLVLIAQKLDSDVSLLVLEEESNTLVQQTVLKLKKRKCMEWLSACFSSPSLPLHRHNVKRQEKLAEKRQAIFGIILSTPIALLTTMKAGSVLPDEHAEWVGGVSAFMWVLVNAGFVMNLYGKTSFELHAAQHLSRLGMLGLAVLVCIYMYMWFFPSLEALFWVLVTVAAFFHCASWLVGCCRHDDDSTFTSPADEECMCARCKPCSCPCRQGDLESSG